MKNKLLLCLLPVLILAGCTPTPTQPVLPPVTQYDFEWVLEPKYKEALEFSHGLCAVSIDDMGGPWGYINTAGEPRIPTYWDSAQAFSDGLACVAMSGRYGIIDVEGHIVVEPFSNVPLVYSDGLMACTIGAAAGYLDEKGQPAVPFIYDDSKSFSNGIAAVCKDGLWCVIDTEGNFVIDPAWEGISVLSDGSVALFDGNLWGLATADGKICFLPRYQQIKAVGGGLYAYSEAGLWGIVNVRGNSLTDAIYADILMCDGGEFYRLVSAQDTYTDGNLAEIELSIPPDVRISGAFTGGFAACINQGGLWGIVGKDGTFAFEPQFEEAITAEALAAYVDTGLLRTADGFAGVVAGFDGASLPYADNEGRVFAMIKEGALWGLAELTGLVK